MTRTLFVAPNRLSWLVAILLLLAGHAAGALPAYGPLVNDFCTLNGREPAQPYDPVSFPAQCQLCHQPGFFDSDPNHQVQPDAQEFINARDGINGTAQGDYGYFCPPATNTPPTLDPIGPRTGTEGQRLTFPITASDLDGDNLAFAAANLPVGAVLTDNGDGTATFDWTPAMGQVGFFDVVFSVTDDAIPPAGAMETVSFTIFNANRAPVLAPIGNRTVDEGATLTFTISASDPDGDALVLSASGIPTGASFSDAGDGTATFSWTPGFDRAGNYPVTFMVVDAGSPMASASESVVITVGDVNRPPVLAPIGDQNVNEGETLDLLLSASDPDLDVLTFQVTSAPTGSTFTDNGDGTAAFSWMPGFGDTGNYAVTFTVNDDGGPSASDAETLTISVGDVNRPPVLAPIGDRTVGEGELLSFVVTATDADGDALTLTAANLPNGAVFTDNGDGTGAFAWTPAFGTTGSYAVTFTVTDAGNPVQTDSEQVALSVGAVNRPPVLAPVGPQSVDEGSPLTLNLSASDPDGDGLTLQVAGAPAGSTLLDNGDGTAVFMWTPGYADAGNVVVTFSVTDDGQPPAMDSEAVTITVGDVNRSPVLSPIGARTVDEGATLAFTVSADDPDGDIPTLMATGLPAGASFVDNGDGSGAFSWTPGFGDMGTYTVTFTASDAGNPPLSASEVVGIAVGDVNRAPVLAPIGSRSVAEGETLSFAVMASDADGDAIALAATSLPAGATFTDNGDGTGSFSWTPGPGSAGSTPVDFTATDTGNPPLADSEAVVLTVATPGAALEVDAWWMRSFGGHLLAKGSGAAPGAGVEIVDADTGAMVAWAMADAYGRFELTLWRQKGRRRLPVPPILPLRVPCAVQARSGGLIGPRSPVAQVDATACGSQSPLLLSAGAILEPAARRIRIGGDHAGPAATVEIRDADTDTVLATVQADAWGRFGWQSAPNLASIACRVRFGVDGQFSDATEVRVRRGSLWQPICPPPAGPLPDPSPMAGTPTGGGTGGGTPAAGGGAPGGGGAPDAGSGGTPDAGSGAPDSSGDGSDTMPPADDDTGSGGASGTPPDPGAGTQAASLEAFQQTVHPLTTQFCSTCHVAGPGSPPIAHPAAATAHAAIIDNQKVDLGAPARSRLVERVAAGHFCWSGDCAADAETMRAAIEQWATLLGGAPDTAGETLVGTAGVTLAQGSETGDSRRDDPDLVALYEFATGSGDVAYDTSGVAPAMDLTLAGPTWIGGGGIDVQTGKAFAGPATSRKLYDLIAADGTGTGEYTIEAWLTPADLDQRGPARIVTYSVSPYERNFMMGQEDDRYVFRNRSRAGGISKNGTPNLETEGGEDGAQTALQHLVMTFDQQVGRQIYLNGRVVEDYDPQGPGALDRWNPEYPFTIANEDTDNRQWKGKVHSVALYKRALSPSDVARRFDGGVGESFTLSFDVSQWVGTPGSAVEMRVSEFDAGAYLLSQPTWVGPAGIAIQDLQIAVNDVVPVAGQAFRNLSLMTSGSPELLSPLASVIAVDRGAELDVFSLRFGVLADHQAVVTGNDPPLDPGGWTDEDRPEVGIRDFEQIHLTMAALTGVDPATRSVERTFEELEQQLPESNDVRSFVPSQQVGIFKLAVEYCDEMVDSRSLREAFFGTGFPFGSSPSEAFADPAMKDLISDRLVDGFYGVDLAGQPTREQVRPIVGGLIDSLTARCGQGSCDSRDTRTAVKGVCSAVLGSAPVVLH